MFNACAHASPAADPRFVRAIMFLRRGSSLPDREYLGVRWDAVSPIPRTIKLLVEKYWRECAPRVAAAATRLAPRLERGCWDLLELTVGPKRVRAPGGHQTPRRLRNAFPFGRSVEQAWS